jgi:hypothetical protein
LDAGSVTRNYSGYGEVQQAWVSTWDNRSTALGAVPGDQYDSPGNFTGVAVIRFRLATPAGAARADFEQRVPTIPARGNAAQAVLFLNQYSDAALARRLIMNLFSLPTAACLGRGVCDTTAGVCSCTTAGASGLACELLACPAGCSGHGGCDTRTGACRCDEFYVADAVRGCALAPLSLASTTCEDDARNASVSVSGARSAPLDLACYLGIPFGMSTQAGFCPPGYDPSPQAVAQAVAGTYIPQLTGCYTFVQSGAVCAGCSGYSPPNVSSLRLAGDTVATSGLGAPPPSDVTFQLSALRSAGLSFTFFTARPGIVRRWASCGNCTAANAYCGARFTVLLDGVSAFSDTVSSSAALKLDVRGVRELRLRTETAPPPQWLPSWEAYSGGPAPGVATQPKQLPFCNGAAWGEAALV